ncbi:OmpA family protein [Breoghania sp. L-A4]|uniref:OmpA family protein n=1 Tax=Breoghania sp. L-A4 TaxID=2304600 RepID=UPI000E359B40|nr:OmpA family protein [Breoghania sp. L-A4]AXS40196.1 hypothetical protein D1F64_09155 [Breoghania sp. L-A4]
MFPHSTARLLLIVGIWITFSSSAALALCPVTSTLDRDAQNESDLNSTAATVPPVDALVMSIAELNGTIGAGNEPVLTFDFASNNLDADRRACLRALGRLAVRADRLGSIELIIIGHADSVDNDFTNNLRSLERARAARTYLQEEVDDFNERVTVDVAGRGEAEPWACGPPDGDEESIETEPCAPRLQMLRLSQAGGEARVRNDRRLEVRLASPVFAGPRYEVLSSALAGQDGNIPNADSEALRDHFAVLRHYPAGTTPLHPVIVPVSDPTGDAIEVCSLAEQDADGGRLWLDTGWQRIQLEIPNSAPVAWDTEPGFVVSAINSSALGNRLLVRLRARPDVRSASGPLRGQIELLLATAIVQDGQEGRQDAAAGVPDPWRVRVRLPHFLDALIADEDETLLNDTQRRLLRSCLGLDPDDVGSQQDRKSLLDSLLLQALDLLPRDGAGLLAWAHDYHAPTGMFALRPGMHLRLLTGRDQLPEIPGSTIGRQDFSDLTSEIVFPLYSAPTRPFVGASQDAVPVLSGLFGQNAVTLDPGLALRWWDAPALANLSQRADDGTFGIGDPAALELLLSGRLAYVIPPNGRPTDPSNNPDYLRVIPRPFIATEALRPTRDTLIVAARSHDDISEFLAQDRDGRLFGSIETDLGDAVLTSACAWGSRDDPNGGPRARVLCGLFTQPMRASLLIDVEVNGEPRRVPLGTSVGSLLPPEVMAPCFVVGTGAADQRLPPGSRLAARITLPTYGDNSRAVYSSDDCRLLALPLVHMERFSWTN